MDKPEAAREQARRPYEPPAIVSEQIFETTRRIFALAADEGHGVAGVGVHHVGHLGSPEGKTAVLPKCKTAAQAAVREILTEMSRKTLGGRLAVTLFRPGASHGSEGHRGCANDVEVEERQLIDRVLTGDKAAQRAFYDGHVDRVFALAYRITGDEAAARDCTQLAFMRLFDKLRTFRGQAALSTWVHAVAVSVILQWLRKTKQHRQRAVDIEAGTSLRVVFRVRQRGRRHRAARDRIAAGRYRTVVVMHDIEGHTHEEIGAALGITVAASKIRLSRARKKLKDELADFAGDHL
jgi:RNA polymerase sigma-70 factor (ECF subfamily)